ncbi:uncharacterized protein LOC133795348 [Humulus lupulus]|uniref:uncharacterized protein LOC133795348 n=1 Tax=Humulus lupulus TaxID=3486 RepID=UPI002B401AF3|nr:uncharacterized protein LOC133795348 [Humulus lupulus]
MATDPQTQSSTDQSSNPPGDPQTQSAQSNPSIPLTMIKNPLEDPSNPYFLHHGDNPGNTLVSQPLTGQDNYTSWSRAMLLAISVKNKIGFLDGSISKPSISDPVLHTAWIRNNNMVISWILNSVSKEISSSILYDESASTIWSDLKAKLCLSWVHLWRC